MSVLDQLASSLGRRDEVPNQELAAAIVRTKNKTAISELVENLGNKNKAIQSDCVKVLYEVGEREPSLIAKHAAAFGELLDSRNGRLVWGAMMALDAIARVDPAGVHKMLKAILAAAAGDSVIARDHAVGILITLSGEAKFAKQCWPLLLDQLKTCPGNQLPMYAEKAEPLINDKNRREFTTILTKRLDGLAKESQKARVRKVLKRIDG